jgi:hypothetical protein
MAPFYEFSLRAVETGKMPVRFIGVGAYSLDVEVTVYLTTSDYDEFVELQQELLLKILQAVESSGTALAVPLQESFESLHGRSGAKRGDQAGSSNAPRI